MKDVLADICTGKRAHVARSKAALSRARCSRRRRGAAAAPLRGSARAHLAEGRYGLIAEIKKASPSAGLIRSDFNPSALHGPTPPAGRAVFQC